MSDYIKREDAADIALELSTDVMYDMIMNIPAADVRENVRGEWKTVQRHEHHPSCKAYEVDYCSVCGKRGSLEYSFCPNCGADMQKGCDT